VHMLLIFDIDDKLREPEEYDRVVRAKYQRKAIREWSPILT